MKKLICYILTGVMVFSLTACEQKVSTKNETQDTTVAAEQQSEASEEQTEASSAEPTETDKDPSAEAVSESELPVCMAARKSYYESSDDGKYTVLYDGHLEGLLLSDDSKAKYPKLADKLYEIYKKEKEDMDEEFSTAIESAREEYKNGYLVGPYSDTYDAKIRRLDGKVLSFYEDYYKYANGPHGVYCIFPHTIDIESGEELELGDIININEEKLKEILIKKIRESAEKINENPDECFYDLDETLSEYKMHTTEGDGVNPVYNWYLDNEGIHFYFEVYSIAAYAYGDTDVLIGYDEMKDIFNDKYLPEGSGAFINQINNPYNLVMDIDGDGVSEKIQYSPDLTGTDGEISVAENIVLEVDGKKASFDGAGQYTEDSQRFYHVRTADNRNYIYIEYPDMSDYYNIYVFDLNNDDVKAVKNGDGPVSYSYSYITGSDDYDTGRIILTDPENMSFGTKYDIFGSMIAVGKYRVGKDGLPEKKDNIYTIDWFWTDHVKSKEDLTLDVVDENGEIVSAGETIKKGETFMPLKMKDDNGKVSLYAKLGDGRIVRLDYSSTKYPAEVDGRSVDDLFDGLQYAG